ncbi:hypothetical protein J2W35_006462 [Variovorax boronicumulans]|uniref:hypothetical protein n=1 Tax=Variovorax boronicumulans TaxID=436515 RepID=UPI00278401AA|nr:hypothetical protein [Variovorax boronicumulans]MDQ0086081.1 hypothetical protein [Variovorax boronicumulans]
MSLTPFRAAVFSAPEYARRLAIDNLQLLSLLKVTRKPASQDLTYLIDGLDATQVLAAKIWQNEFPEAIDSTGQVRDLLHACRCAAHLLCDSEKIQFQAQRDHACNPSEMTLALVAIGKACESLRMAIETHDSLLGTVACA